MLKSKSSVLLADTLLKARAPFQGKLGTVKEERAAPPKQKDPAFDTSFSLALSNCKFDRSFNVAMAFTVRALIIKGVGRENIDKTELTLRQQQQELDLQLATQVVAPKFRLPSFKRHHIEYVETTRPTSLPPLSRRSNQAKDYQLALKLHHFESNVPVRRAFSTPSSLANQSSIKPSTTAARKRRASLMWSCMCQWLSLRELTIKSASESCDHHASIPR